MKKQNVRTLSLIVCTFTYLLIGAAVFDALESEYESEYTRIYEEEENFFKDHYNISTKEYEELRIILWKAMPYTNNSRQWKFPGAFYFSLTVVTTIGEYQVNIFMSIKICAAWQSLIFFPACSERLHMLFLSNFK